MSCHQVLTLLGSVQIIGIGELIASLHCSADHLALVIFLGLPAVSLFPGL